MFSSGLASPGIACANCPPIELLAVHCWVRLVGNGHPRRQAVAMLQTV